MLSRLRLLNVLLVEDEPNIQKALKEVLEFFFARVYVAKNGLEALKVLKIETIQMLFCDYEMPHLNGYELIKEIRETDLRLPITIISNHDDREKLQACIPLGLSGYLFKPLEYSKLKTYLSDLSAKLEQKGFFQYRFSATHILDTTDQSLSVNGIKQQLTKLEFSFLEYMITCKEKVVSKNELEEALYKFELSDSAIKNVIYRLKKKYQFTYIKNVKDMGYILVDNA